MCPQLAVNLMALGLKSRKKLTVKLNSSKDKPSERETL